LNIVKIHTRTLLILGATIFIMIFAMNLFAQYFIQSSYQLAENEEAKSTIGIVTSRIMAETTALSQITRDWAVWNESYQFMEDRNDHYIVDNFAPNASFNNLRVNGFLFYTNKGDYYTGEWYDLREYRKAEVPESLLRYFAGHPGLVRPSEQAEGRSGFIQSSGNLYLVSSYPVLRSSGEGPARGTLIILRLYDDTQSAKLAPRNDTPVRLIPISDQNRFADPVIRELSVPGAPLLVNHVQNETFSTAYSLIRDTEGNPVGVLQADFPRMVYAEGTRTLIFMIGGFLIIGVFYVLMTEIFLRYYVIFPLMDLDESIVRIGKKRDLSDHLTISGDDEIASLKTSFNTMLQELARSQNTLALQADQLAEANRKANMYLNIYLDVVTYELFNAINALDGYAELIRSHGGEKEKGYAERMLQILTRNQAVINNIETISTIYKNPPLQERINLASIVNRVIRGYAAISIPCSGCEITVLADDKLEVVFRNIISNSIRFGGPGVEVMVTTRDLPDGLTEVSVTDTGPGIPDITKPTIFDRFMQNSSTRSSYGLGLHIAKMLVEAYGGRIWADDRVPGHPEQGAVIRFTLKKG
jgi:signal transduction histidine kinase